jgi:hypothetical protein
VRVRERTLLVGRPDETGTRTVVDWRVLENSGERTRVAVGERASWGAPLPTDAQNVELADARLSQFSAEALQYRGDSVLLFAPLSPGRRELVLQYRIPQTLERFPVPLGEPPDSLFVLLEDPGARLASPRLPVLAPETVSGRVFQRFAGAPGAARELVIELPAAPRSSRTVLLALLLLAGLAFGVLAAVTLRRARHPAADPDLLGRRIARLDLDREERGAQISPEEEERYRAERARLKAELERALARHRRGS